MSLLTLAFSLLVVLQAGTGSIEGTIVTVTTDKPIAGAQVVARKVPAAPSTAGITGAGVGALVLENGGRPQIFTAMSDNNGRFVLEDLPSGRYSLTVAADGFSRQQFERLPDGQTGVSTAITINDGQSVKGVIFRLTPAGNVSGRVIGPAGQPLANIEVALLRPMYDDSGKRFTSIATSQTDDRGEYRLFWVTPGHYYVTAGSPSRQMPGRNFVFGAATNKYPQTFYPATLDPSAAVAIDVKPGGEINGIDFRLNEQRTYRIRGRVADAMTGEAPRNASISINPRRSMVMTGSSSSSTPYNGNEGTFELRDVPSGSYWIIAQASLPSPPTPGNGPPRPPMGVASVDVGDSDVDGVVVTIRPPVTISGTIRLEGQPPGSGVAGTAVILRNPQPGFAPIPPPMPARAGTDGTFRIEGVLPGEYRVSVVGLPSRPQSRIYVKEARFGSIDALAQTFTVSGEPSNQLEVALAGNAGEITGSVLDNRLQPLTTAQVALVPDRRDRRDFYRFARTDSSGRFSISSIPPGTYKLFATADLEVEFYDPDVVQQFEPRAVPVNVGESSTTNVELKIDPSPGR